MKITDETKEFISKHRMGTDKLTLRVSSNQWGEHEQPSICLDVYDPFSGKDAVFGTNDTDQIKEIIEHMAKMAGLSVTIEESESPTLEDYRVGARVQITTTEGNLKGELATVVGITPETAYPIEIRTDDGQRFDVKPDELLLGPK